MKIEEILRESPLPYIGYMPAYISISKFTKNDLTWFRQLKRIPRKISAYFDRSKIVKVVKTTHAPDRLNDYYLILATDGTIFMVNY